MKQGRLLVITIMMVIVTIGMGVFHGNRLSRLSAKEAHDVVEISLTSQDARDYLDALIISQNPMAAKAVFKRMPPGLIIQVIKDLFALSDTLSAEDKVHFLLAAASLYTKNQPFIEHLFSILQSYQQKNPTLAPLLVAARSLSSETLKPLAQWAQKKNIYQQWLESAAQQAVTQNDVASFQKWYANDIRPTPAQATTLLMQVVDQGRSADFVPFLVRNLKANVDAAAHKRTLLMRAAATNAIDLAAALLENHADPTIILDPAVGTASQIAFERNYVDMQDLIDGYVISYQKPKKR